MWGSPYYPAGVTDAMIDKYFGDDGSCCEKCRYYLSGTCTKKEDEYSAKELEDMTDEEYEEATHVDSDDYCDDFEWEDDEPEYDDWREDR